MSIEKNTQFGNINISVEAIATLAGGVVSECYGVVGMASQSVFKDGIAELLKKENYSKGIVVRKNDDSTYELDLYIVISYGVRVSEVVYELQKKVKYMVEAALSQEFSKINVYVQDVKVVG